MVALEGWNAADLLKTTAQLEGKRPWGCPPIPWPHTSLRALWKSGSVGGWCIRKKGAVHIFPTHIN